MKKLFERNSQTPMCCLCLSFFQAGLLHFSIYQTMPSNHSQTEMGHLLHMSWFSQVFLKSAEIRRRFPVCSSLFTPTQNTTYIRDNGQPTDSVFLTHSRPKSRSMIHSDMVHKYD